MHLHPFAAWPFDAAKLPLVASENQRALPWLFERTSSSKVKVEDRLELLKFPMGGSAVYKKAGTKRPSPKKRPKTAKKAAKAGAASSTERVEPAEMLQPSIHAAGLEEREKYWLDDVAAALQHAAFVSEHSDQSEKFDAQTDPDGQTNYLLVCCLYVLREAFIS